MTQTTGYIHSYTTGSAHDGPGLRTVVWTTGCHFRCQYCHNPDTWHLKGGRAVTAESVVAEVARHASFMRYTGGGVTISGGEPLVQAPFVTSVLRGCKSRAIHTALDTNGFFGDRLSDDALMLADLVLLDIKSWDPATYRRLTGVEVGPTLAFARRLAALARPAWVRFVLVPGITDDPANIAGLADFVAGLSNVERVEVLPFHQLGRAKWEQLGRAYPLAATPPATAEAALRAAEIFRARGLNTA
ncbi:pyruvate formate lyase-activating protein [Oscillochloris sp. ZM17-4]|uniref:pyruvate formate-lyase-activating protein n=1 Tax=Oscillochloris sp. ZM17-4 TaxID=2866714 RepID=UPI001C72C3B8|nr:pyruvate formate-lyase-activating protein [Oscillochloris sp. ZM17-4]MBX0328790.1 pyruvate formate lyase-activating protein [Oscillochloris sp. ZM17-4]